MTPYVTPRSMKVKEFAEMMRQHGRRDGRHVVVPYSQRELARRCGMSPGTLNYYLDALGDAVIARRPSLTLDLSVAYRANAVDGVAIGSIPVPSFVGGLDPRDAANRDTDDHNIDNCHLGGSDTAIEVAGAERRANGSLRSALQALHAMTALLRQVLVEVERASEAREYSRVEPDSEFADSRDRASDRAIASRASATHHLHEMNDDESHSSSISSRGQLARSDDELAVLVEPLAEEVARRGLVPLGDRIGLRRALADFDDTEIDGAVQRLVRRLCSGDGLRNPFGFLISRAEAVDRSLFAPPPTPTPAPPPRQAVVASVEMSVSASSHYEPPYGEVPSDARTEDADDAWWQLAELAITEMDADPAGFAAQLGSLGSVVDERLARMPASAAGLVRGCEPMFHAFRVDAYRELLIAASDSEVER